MMYLNLILGVVNFGMITTLVLSKSLALQFLWMIIKRKSGLLLRPLFYCARLMRKMFIDQALYEKEREIGLPCQMCLKQKRRDARFRKRLKERSNFLQMPMRWKLEKHRLNQMRNLLKERNLKRFVVNFFWKSVIGLTPTSRLFLASPLGILPALTFISNKCLHSICRWYL